MEIISLGNHIIRKALMLSLNEMAVLCDIKKMCQSPETGFWCVKTKDGMAEWLDLSRATIFNALKALESKGYIVKSNMGIRPSKFIYDLDLAEDEIGVYIKTNDIELISAKMREILSLDGQSKNYTMGLNSRPGQSKNYTLDNNIDIYKENINIKNINIKENSELTLFTDTVNTKKEKNKNKKEGAAAVPNLEEFVDYAAQLVDKSFSRKLSEREVFNIQQKYQAWVDNGWRDGYNTHIKVWKSKLGTNLKFLLDNGNGNNKGTGQANFSGTGGKQTGIVSEADYFNYLISGQENSGSDGQGVPRTLELPDSNDGS